MKLPFFQLAGRQRSPQPFSVNTHNKGSRLLGAKKVESVCPYCAVGCGTNIYVKGGQVIDIEGNPRSPINEGTLCPKGANIFQLAVNPHRVTHVLYRAPFAEQWERKPLDWAIQHIAERIKATRDAGFTAKSEKGYTINAV